LIDDDEEKRASLRMSLADREEVSEVESWNEVPGWSRSALRAEVPGWSRSALRASIKLKIPDILENNLWFMM
jgi:hypothetical protein